MYPVKIDASRATDEVKKIRDRAITIENFVKQKLEILDGVQPSIQNFMEKVGATELSLENMYSTGSVSHETYSGDCWLMVHGVLTLKKEFANKNLLAKKLNDNWKELVPSVANAQFVHYKIVGCIVKFELLIK